MALKKRSYGRAEIESIDVNNIPADFEKYILSQTADLQKSLLSSRLDLAEALGIEIEKSEIALSVEPVESVVVESPFFDDAVEEAAEKKDDVIVAVSEENVENREAAYSSLSQSEDTSEEDMIEESEDEIDILTETVENIELDLSDYIYDADYIASRERKDIIPLRLLAKDESDSCRIHRCKYSKHQLSYGNFGIYVYYCPSCKMLYKENSSIEGFYNRLTEIGIDVEYQNYEDTTRYLLSHMEPIDIEREDVVYVSDTWVQEHPVCPLHETDLELYPYRISYNDRKVEFYAHFCNECNKIIIRKSRVDELHDLCGEAKVPVPEFEVLRKQEPAKPKLKPKDFCPDFYIDQGKKEKYEGKHNDCYQLEEKDTVIISDTRECDLFGHSTDDVLIGVSVLSRKKGKQRFLCIAGYCSECDKYYMEAPDYDVLYKTGRPEITVLLNTDNDYMTTSGETFEKERKHLAEIESSIAYTENDIRGQSDYVNPYQTGDYDDGGLKYAKKLSSAKYDDVLQSLQSITDKPYKHHVNLMYKGEKVPFYVGISDVYASEVVENGKKKYKLRVGSGFGDKKPGEVQVVYSTNSQFGKEIVNYRTVEANYKNEKCEISLIRELEIEKSRLYGYLNIRTNADKVFRTGVTDPFLIKVLRSRRNGHHPDDIFTTIQENQNSIVDERFDRSIIVQGCAGSGKTMVLLHRLSSLKYNHPEFDFGKSIIITPNEHFNLQIKGVADGLQIGGILRESVEQYYVDALLKYSEEFKPKGKIGDEMRSGVSQNFVDFIYSDDFIYWFDKAYSEVLSERDTFVEKIRAFASVFGVTPRDVDLEKNEIIYSQYKMELDRFTTYVNEKNRDYERAKEDVHKKEARKKFLEERVESLVGEVDSAYKNIESVVATKVKIEIDSLNAKIQDENAKLGELNQELEQLSRGLFVFGRATKKADLEKQIHASQKVINDNQKRIDDIESRMLLELDREDETSYIKWAMEVADIVPAAMDGVRFYNRMKDERNNFLQELAGMEVELADLRQKQAMAAESIYSDQVIKTIKEYAEELERYKMLTMFERVFDLATAEFISLNKIKPNKTVRRYTLYAQLLFAMKFFGDTHEHNKLLCIDEGQDLALNEFRLIRKLNGEDAVFNIFGDTNQLLKPNRGINDWNVLEEFLDAKVFSLNENYRNTNQITKFCNMSFGMEVLQTGVDGSKVHEISRKELEGKLCEVDFSTERVAVLIPRKVVRRTLEQEKKKKKDSSDTQGYIQYDLLPDDIAEKLDDSLESNKISYMYVDEVKGIEFDKVFVVPNGMTENEKYIAYTRALSELILVIDDKITPPNKAKAVKMPTR